MLNEGSVFDFRENFIIVKLGRVEFEVRFVGLFGISIWFFVCDVFFFVGFLSMYDRNSVFSLRIFFF